MLKVWMMRSSLLNPKINVNAARKEKDYYRLKRDRNRSLRYPKDGDWWRKITRTLLLDLSKKPKDRDPEIHLQLLELLWEE